MASDGRYQPVRTFLLILSACLLSAAGKPDGQDGKTLPHQIQPKEIDEKAEKAREPLPSSTMNTNTPSRHDQPCPTGRDDRDSDLCAQWKAADAAKSAADAAWWIGGAGVLISALTLLTAIAAAAYARGASNHTKEGAIQAKRASDAAEEALSHSRKASQTDLRAWVNIKADLIDYKRTKDFAHFDIEVSLLNLGKTPALNVGISHEIHARESIIINNGTLPEIAALPHAMPPLMPNEETRQAFGLRIANQEIEQAIQTAAKSGFAVMAVIDLIVYYRLAFDEADSPNRMTSIRYTIHPDIDPYQFPNAWRQIGLEWIDDQNYMMDRLIFVQDKSAPTHLT